MRFRPEQHLRRQNDIRAVREFGARSDWRLFTLWCYFRPAQAESGVKAHSGPKPDSASAPGGRAPPRVAVVASIAAIGNAIQRARAKRRLREVFRHQQHLVPAGCDLLLVARTAINQCSFVELEQRFIAAVGKIRVPEAIGASDGAGGSASALGLPAVGLAKAGTTRSTT